MNKEEDIISQWKNFVGGDAFELKLINEQIIDLNDLESKFKEVISVSLKPNVFDKIFSSSYSKNKFSSFFDIANIEICDSILKLKKKISNYDGFKFTLNNEDIIDLFKDDIAVNLYSLLARALILEFRLINESDIYSFKGFLEKLKDNSFRDFFLVSIHFYMTTF